MTKSRFESMKSGWHSVFNIFTRAAADDLEYIIEQAFENVEQGFEPKFFLSIFFYVSYMTA